MHLEDSVPDSINALLAPGERVLGNDIAFAFRNVQLTHLTRGRLWLTTERLLWISDLLETERPIIISLTDVTRYRFRRSAYFGDSVEVYTRETRWPQRFRIGVMPDGRFSHDWYLTLERMLAREPDSEPG